MTNLLFYSGLGIAAVALIIFIITLLFRRKLFGNSNNKRRSFLILLPIFAGVFFVGCLIAFTGYTQTRHESTVHVFVEQSANAYRRGDIEEAVRYALQALPVYQNVFMAPRTPQAIRALADALEIYKMSDTFRPFGTWELPAEPTSLSISPDGRTAVAVYADEALVFDTETLEAKVRLPMIESEMTRAVFLNNSQLVYTGEIGVTVYDFQGDNVLWFGKPATNIAVSPNGYIAIVFEDENETTIYDSDGNVIATLSFAGRSQHVAPNYEFADMDDNLLAFNSDGSLLAVSFSDGSLVIFDLTNSANSRKVLYPSNFTRFDGGFFENYFAFSAIDGTESAVAVLDLVREEQIVGFQDERRLIATVDENGIYLQSANMLLKLDPASGELIEMAYSSEGINAFAGDASYMLVATADNISIFDRGLNLLDERHNAHLYDFVQLSGDYAILGSRDSTILRVLKLMSDSESIIFTYEPGFEYSDIRVNEDHTRVVMRSEESFRVYDITGNLISETLIPYADFVSEFRFSQNYINLIVIYPDSLRIYSGSDGSLLFEQTDLRSVFFAYYGVSILDNNGALSLVNLDTASVEFIANVEGDFAAYCGMIVDSAFLQGRELLGAFETETNYLFVISNGEIGSVYNEAGNNLFDIPATRTCEAFFTTDSIVISPTDIPAAAYNNRTGVFIGLLEPNMHLVSLTPIGNNIASKYRTAEGRYFSILLDENFEPIATLPRFIDVADSMLIFNCNGVLRQSRIFSVEELISVAIDPS